MKQKKGTLDLTKQNTHQNMYWVF